MKEVILREIKENNLPVIICGAGIVGDVLLSICNEAEIQVECFCDGSKKVSQTTFCGKEVIYTPDLKSRYNDAILLISAAAIKDVVDLLHEMGFSKWYAGGLLLKDMDVSQTGLLDYRKFAVENCILCHEGFLNRDEIFIRSIDLIITERCSLRCRDCSNLMQYYEKPQNCDKDMLLASIDAFFRVVDKVMDFRIIGGETFMNKEWPVFVRRITEGIKPDDPEVERVVLYTNATIIPTAEDIECLKNNDKGLVIATDYGPSLSRKLVELKQILEQNNVTHQVLEMDEWLDCSAIKPHNRSVEENLEIYKKCCAKNMSTLSDGKLFRCPYAANAARLCAVPDFEDDYVDLFKEPLDETHICQTKKKVRDYLLHKDYLKTCDFCDGRPLSGTEVTPAIQADKPLAYRKYIAQQKKTAMKSLEDGFTMPVQKIKPEENNNRNKLKAEKPYVYNKIIKFDEKISRGESIAIIQFQYNYKCNLTCKHCSVKRFQGKNNARQFTIPDVKDLFRQADEMGLARVTITGGEPLIFKDFDELVAAIDPEKFFINCDTNGWFFDENKARHLKSIGVDRIQPSIDSLDAEEHDSFRGAKGSHERAMKAVDIALDAGLGIFVQTVVTKQRLYSEEFIEYVEYFNQKGVGVFVSYAKPVGSWEGNFDVLVDKDDMKYMENLEKKHKIFTHLTHGYGLNMGCIAVKGMFSITQYGDVLPCPYIHTSIGNVFEEPLKDIIQRGLDIKYFGERVDTCLIAEDRAFIKNIVAKNIYGKPLPVPCSEVFTDDDKTKKPFNKDERLFPLQ